MIPTTYRDAVVQGVHTAAALHQGLSLRDASSRSGGNVDVFKAIDDQGYALMFKPLKGLLGLCMQEPTPGILVTTNRSLSVQRFTAAHELGHLEMGHEFSLDDEEYIYNPSGTSPKQLQEVAANSFGAEFLMPKWLIREKMERHSWTVDNLDDPRVVYQLSLRLGTSYDATCRALDRHNWIDGSTSSSLLSVTPKSIKAHVLNGEAHSDPWADVWELTHGDHGETITAGPTDVFLLRLEEHGSSGFLWNTEHFSHHGFNIEQNELNDETDVIGSSAIRCWKLFAEAQISGQVRIEESRPWQPDDILGQFEFEFSLMGKEFDLPRAQRQYLQAA